MLFYELDDLAKETAIDGAVGSYQRGDGTVINDREEMAEIFSDMRQQFNVYGEEI